MLSGIIIIIIIIIIIMMHQTARLEDKYAFAHTTPEDEF